MGCYVVHVVRSYVVPYAIQIWWWWGGAVSDRSDRANRFENCCKSGGDGTGGLFDDDRLQNFPAFSILFPSFLLGPLGASCVLLVFIR